MPLVLIAVGETWDFALKEGEEVLMTVTLRILDSLSRYALSLEVWDTLPERGENPSSEHAAACYQAARFGIVGWSLEKPPFETERIQRFGKAYDVMSDKLLGMIPMPEIQTIAYELLQRNRLSDAEKKT